MRLLGSLTTRDFDAIHLGTREISGRDYRDFFITTLKKTVTTTTTTTI